MGLYKITVLQIFELQSLLLTGFFLNFKVS